MEEQNATGWEAPPPPELIPKEEPEMSEVQTLGSIFFEPGRTFQDLRRKPRFIAALVIISLLVMAYVMGLHMKFGEQGMRQAIAEQMDRNERTASLTPEQKQGAIDMQMKISSFTRYLVPVFVIIAMVIGGLIYWLAAKAFGGSGGFMHAFSVWVYSSFPPTVVSMVASLIVLVFKSTDNIDLAASQKGLITANPSMFIDGNANPVVGTLLATFDLFLIWGWVLAAIGLRITNRLSSGSAWAIVLILALVSTTLRVVGALFSGTVN